MAAQRIQGGPRIVLYVYVDGQLALKHKSISKAPEEEMCSIELPIELTV